MQRSIKTNVDDKLQIKIKKFTTLSDISLNNWTENRSYSTKLSNKKKKKKLSLLAKLWDKMFTAPLPTCQIKCPVVVDPYSRHPTNK